MALQPNLAIACEYLFGKQHIRYVTDTIVRTIADLELPLCGSYLVQMYS